MITIFFYVISLVGIGLLSLFTYSRRTEKGGIYFSLMSLFLAAWLGCQFLATRFPSAALGITVAGLIIFSFVAPLCALFSIEFVGSERRNYSRLKTFTYGALIIMLVTAILPGTIQSAKVINGGLVVETGLAYTVQTVLAIFLILASIWLFIRNYSGFSSAKRLATYYLVIGLGLAVIGNSLSGFVFSDIAAVQFLGPLSILLMTSFITYSITRHRLFDIRAAVARTVAYAVTIILLVTFFFVISSSLIARFVHNPSLERLINALLLIAFIFLAQPLKGVLDRISNSFFYRDAYDFQAVLNTAGDSLLSTIEVEKLAQNITKILEDSLKSSVGGYYLATERSNGKQFYASNNLLLDGELKTVTHLVSRTEATLVVSAMTDKQDVRNELVQHDIELITALRTNDRFIGWLFLGNKRNGSLYTETDIRLFSIIAHTLSIALENALRFEEIQQFNLTLQQKVDDATRQLRRTNEKLRQLDETKDEFISMASHQLRTPLTSMKGYVSMVLEGDSGRITSTQRKLLDQAFVSSQRMVYLIADLLNVSRLRTGKFIIENKPTNLAEVVDTEISQLIETAKGRGLELTYNKPKDFPTLMLDETKMRQVIMNFADNAIYYTPSGGHIQVNLEDKGNTIEYTVVDDGLGVPKTEQHHLFTKFFRAGNARKARPDGTGLGLFMAKKVIVTQGGAIIFHSEEGKGSTFGFSFAKSALQPVPKASASGPVTSSPVAAPSAVKPATKPTSKPAAKPKAKTPAAKKA